MRTDRGFTLLEVLVAFTVLALVMGAAYATMSSGIRATARTDQSVAALGQAESTLARVGIDRPLVPGDWTFREHGWITQITISPHGGNGTVWQRVGQQPLRVDVRVRETERGGDIVHLETLRLGLVAQ